MTAQPKEKVDAKPIDLKIHNSNLVRSLSTSDVNNQNLYKDFLTKNKFDFEPNNKINSESLFNNKKFLKNQEAVQFLFDPEIPIKQYKHLGKPEIKKSYRSSLF